jgi:hypothetical protein
MLELFLNSSTMTKSHSDSPNVHDYLDQLSPEIAEPIAMEESLKIVIAPFKYMFYQIQVPLVANLTEGEQVSLMVGTTRFCGEYSIYTMAGEVPSYFRRQQDLVSGTGGVSILLYFRAGIPDLFYISVEGSRQVMWEQSSFSHGPAVSSLSMRLWSFKQSAELTSL